MGLALYVLIKDSPLWLPTFLALYAFVRGGPRRRCIAAILWPPALILAFATPLAGEREPGAIALILLGAAVAGGMTGYWQRRTDPL